MSNSNPCQCRGIIHGRTIQLDADPGLADGQAVSVTLSPASPSCGGLEASFGAWSEDDPQEFAAFLDEMRKSRQSSDRETDA